MLPDVTQDGIADSQCNVLTFILKGKCTVSTDLIKPQLQPFFIENQQSSFSCVSINSVSVIFKKLHYEITNHNSID